MEHGRFDANDGYLHGDSPGRSDRSDAFTCPDPLPPGWGDRHDAATDPTGATPVLLTGDNLTTATQLAGRLPFTDVRAGLLPDDKDAEVRELGATG